MPLCTIDFADFLTPEGYAATVTGVLAVMLYPRDTDARNTFKASVAVDLMESQAETMSPRGVVTMTGKRRGVEIREPRRLVDEAMVPVIRKPGTKRQQMRLDDPYSGPNVAATILERAFTLADEGWPEAGITQVLDEQRAAYQNEGLTGAGRDKLQEIWEEYRPAAHIALAFRAMSGRSMKDPGVFFNWIGLATDILRAGKLIGSRFANPILPPGEAWLLPMMPSAMGSRAVTGNFRDSVLVTSPKR